MSPAEFTNNHKSLLKSLKKELESKGISVTADFLNADTPYLGSSMINGTEGYYFKVNQRDFLTEDQRDTINNTFPIKIYIDSNIYSAKLLSIGDYDWDDDRYWLPSISFLVIKNGKPMI